MTALDFSVEKFIHRLQIIQLLRLAIDKRWRFTYMLVSGKKVSSNPIGLQSVNADEGTFTLDREIPSEDRDVNQPVLFRAQGGGVSILFQSKVAAGEVADDNGILRSARHVDLPYEVRCTQLRNSERVNVESRADQLAATLHLAMGFKLEGKLVDISVSGAQIRVLGDQSERLKNLEILEACQIALSEDFVLHSSAQLTGMNYSEDEDASLVHCQFDEMAAEDENKLGSFISSAISASPVAMQA